MRTIRDATRRRLATISSTDDDDAARPERADAREIGRAERSGARV